MDQIISAIKALYAKHGSYQAVAKSIGVSPAYLSDVLRGRRDCSDNMAKKLGLRRVIEFVPIPPQRKEKRS